MKGFGWRVKPVGGGSLESHPGGENYEAVVNVAQNPVPNSPLKGMCEVRVLDER